MGMPQAVMILMTITATLRTVRARMMRSNTRSLQR